MEVDWFRSKTWTPADREAFFIRLRRSRGMSSKAQYLRIQALELLTTGTPEGIGAALELANLLLQDYPEPFEMAQTYLIRAECLELRGDIHGAIASYRNSLQSQRNQPNVKTSVHREFAWLIATEQLAELYQEALNALDEFGDSDGFFPLSLYKSSAARALIESALGNHSVARQSAQLALEASAAKHSGLRNHPRLGLVTVSNRRVHERLEEIVAAAT